MLKHSTYLLLIILLGFSKPTSAQTNYIFELITFDEKANFGDVHNICQDSAGIIWLGVFGKGLAYYNGKKVQRFLIEDEVEFSNRWDLFAEGEGLMYLNYGNKVKIFDPIQQTIIDSIAIEDENGFEIDRLLFLKKSTDNILYAIREEQKDEKVTKETIYDVLVSHNGDPFVKITDTPIVTRGETFIKNMGQTVLIKTKNGFRQINEQGETIKNYPLPNLDMLYYNELNCDVGAEKNIWFVGNCVYNEIRIERCKGVYIWEHQSDSLLFYEAPSDYLESLNIPPFYKNFFFSSIIAIKNEIWTDNDPKDANPIFSVENRIFKKNTWLTINKQKRWGTGQVFDHFIDKTGTIWLASQNGLNKFVPQPEVFKLLPCISLRGMIEDEAGVIYGHMAHNTIPGNTDKDAVFYTTIYNPKSGTDNVEYHPIEVTPAKGHSEQLRWFNPYYHNGTIHFGYSQLDIPSNEHRHVIPHMGSGAILSLIDRQSKIWKTGWYLDHVLLYGLEDMNLIKRIPIPVLSENPIQLNDLYQRPSDGTVWLGTYGQGVFIFPEEGGSPIQLSRSKDSPILLNSNIVSGMYENKTGEMWLGTGAGLSCISADFKNIRHFSIDKEKSELYLVYAIVPDDDDRYLWLSTNQGIFRFDTKDAVVMDFPLNPFVMQAEYNRNSFFKGSNGQLYFGGNTLDNRTVSFLPDEVIEFYENKNLSSAQIIFTDFSKYDAETKKAISQNIGLQALDQIILNPGDRFFSLEYSTADYRNPTSNFYSFYLEGYDESWNEPQRGNNRVRYENLPPGKYTLKMRGALMKNNIDLNERQLSISVLPFWYQTWWSKILFGLIFGTGFYLFYQFRLKRQLETQEAIRLRDLDNLKTRLYTNITHEFRTPLTVIMGMNDNIQGFKQERNLIQRNAKNLLRLINQLLDLSKLDSGTLKMDATQGDVIGYLHYLTESFYSMATDKKVNLRFLPEIKSLVMDFDEVKIQHVVYNLLSNAIKFTRPGGKVSLETSGTSRNGNPYLKIKVRDSGIGIPEKYLPHIFDRFYQVENTISTDHSRANSTNNFAGTGIGLALTKELIELMGGTISVKSELEWGTEFTVLLPVQENMSTPKMEVEFEAKYSENDLAPDFEALPAKPDQINGKKPQVLIMEDNAGVVTYIKSLLENDYYLQVAINGQEGTEMALEFIPDLIITDVMMPEKNGYEVCHELKEDRRTSHIPIIMLTAKADLDSKLEGLEKGADVYLSKPFNKKELLLRVRKLLELRQQLQAHYLSVAGLKELPADGAPSAPAPEDTFVKKARMVVEDNLDNYNFKVENLCRELLMSHSQLHRKLSALTGLSANKFIRSIRLAKAKEMMKDPELLIANIAFETGFDDPNYFSRIFRQEFGKSPSEWRETEM